MEWNDRRGLKRSFVERGTLGAPELPRWLKSSGPGSSLDIHSRPETLARSQYALNPDMSREFSHLPSSVYPSDVSLYGGLGRPDAGQVLFLNPDTAQYFPSSAPSHGVSALPPSVPHFFEPNNPLLATHSNGLLSSADDYLTPHSSQLHPHHQFAPLETRKEPLAKVGDYVPYGSSAAPPLTRVSDYTPYSSLAALPLARVNDYAPYSSLAAPPRDRNADLLSRSGLSQHSLPPLKRSRYLPPRGRSPLPKRPPPRHRSPPRGSSPKKLSRSQKRKLRLEREGKDVNAVAKDVNAVAGSSPKKLSRSQKRKLRLEREGKDVNAVAEKSKKVETKKQEKKKGIEVKKQNKVDKVEVKKQDALPASKEATKPAKSAATDKPTVENPVAGMVFGCNNNTEKECRRLQLFGLPAARKNDALRVIPGTKLFLYNFDSKELSGVFEAASYGAIDIVPHAFKSYGSFPAQVRTKRIMKVPNLPLKVFKEAIKENFYSYIKFNYELNASQGRILDFKVSLGGRSISEVLVQHVYMHSEISVSGVNPHDRHRSNYLYPSDIKEWELASSLAGIIDVMHSDISVLQYKGRTSSSLMKSGIFFYDSYYKHENRSLGSLETLPLLIAKSGFLLIPILQNHTDLGCTKTFKPDEMQYWLQD